MRYLRSTMYKNDEEHVTMVTAEDSLKDEIHVAANEMVTGDNVDVEIFDCDGDLVSATLEGEQRALPRLPDVARKGIILTNWCIAMLQKLKPDGLLGTKSPVPLEAEIIEGILREVAQHHAYKDHRIILISGEEPRMVTLKNGQVRTTVMGS